MMRRDENKACGCAIEVYGMSAAERNVMAVQLHRAFAKSGCWVVRYKRCGRAFVQYSFDVELGAAIELYCGVVEAGLELSEVSHRALTELCLLRSHERACAAGEQRMQRMVKVRLMVGFLEQMGEVAADGVVAALA